MTQSKVLVGLGVQKKTTVKRNKRKKMINKVIHYLTSDTYMFAPLISHPPHAFRSPIKTPTSSSSSSSTSGLQARQPIEGNSKRLLNNVGDYLKSDSYMYAPLLVPPPQTITSTTSPPKGSSEYLERVVTMAVSKKKLIFIDNKSNEPNDQPCAKAIARNDASKGHRPKKVISEKQSVVHKETVKHVVPNSCRSSLMSEKNYWLVH
ncbi:uncharacterized protein [Malus domestica]|uniref:uncharacterized protein n=1 Tax=Malus domestica TaxID=3750 RepID=UPI0039749B15